MGRDYGGAFWVRIEGPWGAPHPLPQGGRQEAAQVSGLNSGRIQIEIERRLYHWIASRLRLHALIPA